MTITFITIFKIDITQKIILYCASAIPDPSGDMYSPMVDAINMQTHDALGLQVALYQEKGGTAHFWTFLGNEKFMHQEVE
ncbi:hypothetical protein D3C78_1421530 [compost metagenome]